MNLANIKSILPKILEKKSAPRILFFVAVDEKCVAFSMKLMKLRGFQINNDNINDMRLTI